MSISKWLFGSKNDNIKENENTETNDLIITKVNIEYEAICPYCNTLLNKIPILKTKCPHCKNSIFVRKSNDSKIRTLVTEEKAQQIDIGKEKEYLK
jgi:Zn finger protein HypA/HybF involved in hydrogenase expression